MITFFCWVAAFVLLDAAWRARQTSRRRAALLVAVSVILVIVSLAVVPNMLVFGKVAGRLAMPVGLCWVGLAACAGYFWVRRMLRRTAIASAAFVLFTVLGNAPLGGMMLAGLESDYIDDAQFSGAPLDALFVLGGATAQSPGGGPPRLADSGDRVLTAARVYHARPVGTVVTSGSSIPGLGPARDVAAEAAHILEELDVPRAVIVEIPAPKNSAQEVAAYRALATKHGWTKLGIVTSAWHMRRVQRLCERADLDAEPIPADFRGSTTWDGLASLIPDASGFRDIQRASWELLGAAVGR